MSNLELTGKIIEIHTPKRGVSQRTGNAWMTQEYIIETEEQYPKKVPFEIFGEDKIRQFSIQMNERVTIKFNIEGSEYNGKWYVRIKCYDVIREQVTQPQPAVVQPIQPPIFNEPQSETNDDLPF